MKFLLTIHVEAGFMKELLCCSRTG